MYFIDERELSAIDRVFKSRKLFRYQLSGPGECDLFEEEFARKIGSPFSILLSSGTNALIAALAAGGIGPGDEVLIPAYTFAATAVAVINVGATPVVVNINETLGMDTSEAETKVSSRTKAIIPVHMDGLATDMATVRQLADRHSLLLIEDVAQAIGGSFKGRRLGTWGEFGCFSLNENKNISCGEGGILAVSSRERYEKAFAIHDNSAQYIPGRKDIFTTAIPGVGQSMRVSEISGAIMRVQLERLDGILSGLRERKQIWVERLGGMGGFEITRGACAVGDCASSLHLIFSDPEQGAVAGKKLRGAGLLFATPTSRPAHAAWKWGHGHTNADFIPSISILTRTLKYDIDLRLSIAETGRLVSAAARILASG